MTSVLPLPNPADLEVFRTWRSDSSRWLPIGATSPSTNIKRRLMALMLLHRASDPVRHICIEDWQSRADNLVQLQELIWPD